MTKWIILLLIVVVILTIAYKWLRQRYFIKNAVIRDVDASNDKAPLNTRDQKFSNPKALGKVPYKTKHKKDELNVESVKSALKNQKKGKHL